jgi:hypothetical protein
MIKIIIMTLSIIFSIKMIISSILVSIYIKNDEKMAKEHSKLLAAAICGVIICQ